MSSVCVFCRIVLGLEAVNWVAKWADAVAIVPLNPITPGHVLIIPAAHVNDFAEDPFITGLTFKRAAELTTRLKLRSANLIASRGIEATQSIFHLHVHLVPRKASDGLALPWHPGGES